ncbi:hypothetical protein [Agrobacterium tumefaciens]|uniref:hypothetical protein n=1 Tax=Agrobacterium tumefaciens TaxID=358 RepID=UPI000686088B|nr:hypothetical protein [Agrobacterium tumefaciens]
MPYVERTNGAITGAYAMLQSGYAEEFVADDNAELVAFLNREPPAQPITRRQLRLTLVRNGISLAGVEAAIAAMPDGLEKEEAQIEWADASTFNRDHPTLLLIAAALGLTEVQVNAMWEEAVLA